MRGESDSAWYLFNLAFKANSGAPLELRLKFLNFSITQNRYREAEENVRAVINELSGPKRSLAEGILAALGRRNKKEVDSLVAILTARLK